MNRYFEVSSDNISFYSAWPPDPHNLIAVFPVAAIGSASPKICGTIDDACLTDLISHAQHNHVSHGDM